MRFQIDKRRMLPHQREFWELPNYVKLLVGGYGSGKTHIGAVRSIWNSYVNAPLPHLSISPTFKTARKTVIISIGELLDKAGVRYTYHKTNHEFHIHNWNGRIWIASGDEPDSLKGPNLATIGIDEPFIQKKEVFDIALSRLRHPAATVRELFMTGTPEELNWGYEVAENAEGRYDLGVVIGRTRDNTHLPGQFIDTLESAYDDNQRAAYMEGKFVNLTAGRVYRYFERRLDCRAGGPLPGERVEGGIDFNVDYMTAELFVQRGGGLHFFEEVRMADADTYALAEVLHQKYPGITLYPDASGSSRRTSSPKTDHMILREKGFRVLSPKSNPPVRDRVNAVNNMARNRLLTIGDCPHLLKDFEQVVWKNGEVDKRSDPRLTHASDAAGYAINYLFPVKVERLYTAPQPTAWRP